MHKCVSYSLSGSRNFEEEYPWSLALYIELNLGKDKEVVVCSHPTYIIVSDLLGLAKRIHSVEGSELEYVQEISNLLDALVADWRKEFEIVIRRYFVAISIYL